jgi:DNA mismatch repair protein MutH
MPVNPSPLANLTLPYNPKDPKSIEQYARLLLEKSLKDVLGTHIKQTYIGKGKLGQILEDLYFKYKPNSNAEPDFKEASVELKTTPLKKIKKGLTSKERLVFNIINYEEEHKESFLTSSFWKKNQHLLLMFYLYEKEKIDLDYIFKIIKLWQFPAADLKIIQDDWEKIVAKIKSGQAHQLSEGDTLYLGACTKGTNKLSVRSQPFSDKMAMQRAFSLKSKYLNFIIQQSLGLPLLDAEPIVKSVKEFSKKETFEDLVIKRFQPFYGLTDVQLAKQLNLKKTDAKSKFYLISKAISMSILGISKGKIEEFEKADVIMKTIRLEHSGGLKESMSFAQIQFKEIIKESWEESYWFETLTKRFFFVIYQKDANGILRLRNVFFWTMPSGDLEIAKQFWLDTKKKIINDDYTHFIKISDDRICHVRPKGADSKDLMEAPSGRMEKKKCYWLNASYIKRAIVVRHLD